MGDSTATDGEMNNSDMIDLTGKLTVVGVLLVFVILIFVFLIHIYAKWYLIRRRDDLSNNSNSAVPRRRFGFAPPSYQMGLDSSVLKTIPVIDFTAKEFKEGFECSICLCEVSEGEKTRFLPNCNHGFHVNCIDTWFQTHSSCPICRDFVANSIPESKDSSQLQNSEDIYSEWPRNFPTNVLFWGNEVEVRTLGNYTAEEEEAAQEHVYVSSSSSSSSISISSNNRNDGVLVIDIPQQINEDEDQETKSPTIPSRLGSSLKRLLSRDNRRVGPCSPRDLDIEQATRS